MPTLRAVLDDATRKEFETPPLFDTSQRRIFFNISSWDNRDSFSKSVKNARLKLNFLFGKCNFRLLVMKTSI